MRRLGSTSANAPNTSQSRLTTLGRLGWEIALLEEIKTAVATIAAHGETKRRLDARHGAMSRRGIAAYRRPTQVFSIFDKISQTGAYGKYD